MRLTQNPRTTHSRLEVGPSSEVSRRSKMPDHQSSMFHPIVERFLVAMVAAIPLLVLFVFFVLPAAAQDATFDSSGALQQPAGYREWVYVGTPLTPNDMNAGEAPFPEFHSVYINPSAWQAYQRSGKFPDGTVVVKELISVGEKQASSGKGYFMGEFIGLEAAVKDSTRFSDAAGHWAYFSFGHSYPLAKTTKAQPTATCAACHQALAADDMVFTQYYPVLRAAKGKQ